jgi:hypothetical protein
MSSFRGRKRGVREPLSTLYIVCEGKKTEPLYFDNYRTIENNVRIRPIPSPKKNAIGVVDFAITKIKRGDFSLKDNDEVICVFDCDANTEVNLEEAFKKARTAKIKMCLSNPRFELWFLLHYECDKNQFTKEKLESRLEKHIPNYKKNQNYYDKLSSNMDYAIKNANKLNKYHSSNGTSLESVKSNPSTQVHEVIALIHGFNSQK